MSRIRYGMVGGGPGAFIGSVHRHAAALDGQYELVCGAFSSDQARCLETGTGLGIEAGRCYENYSAMMAAEAALPADRRMQVVVIATPNHLHYPVACEALRQGFHVISDKPATLNVEEARQLSVLLDETGLLYGLTHPYTGYPMIREARQRVISGELGLVRKIIVEYTQGWLASAIENDGNRQAGWRLDPAQAGASCCMGDIGVHAFNLTEFVSGLYVHRLSAQLNTIVTGRSLDDDGTVLMEFNNGARGVLIASQVCTGEENNLRLRIYGEQGGLDWCQEDPNTLWLKYPDQPTQRLRSAMPYSGASALANTRVPPGHPEGYIEAFANLYREFAAAVRIQAEGQYAVSSVPGAEAALRGMIFIDTAVRSSRDGNSWLSLQGG